MMRSSTWLFQFVGDDTTYEVRGSRSQGGHQVVQLFLEIVKKSIMKSKEKGLELEFFSVLPQQVGKA